MNQIHQYLHNIYISLHTCIIDHLEIFEIYANIYKNKNKKTQISYIKQNKNLKWGSRDCRLAASISTLETYLK